MSNPITVVLTCAASPMAVEMIRALQRCRSAPVRVVGVDMEPNGVGRSAADAYEQVPSGRDPAYVDRLLEICRRHEARLVIPCSDEEALTLAKTSDRFQAAGTLCTVPRREFVDLFSDKATMLQWLKSRGVPVPNAIKATTADELVEAAKQIGYPQRPCVVKPVSGRGGRGVWLLREQGSSLEELTSQMSLDVITLETFLRAMRSHQAPTAWLVMEQLTGPVFDVDVLARAGEPLAVVARRRFHPRTTPFRGCVLEPHPGVLALAYQILTALQLHYLHDIDIMLDAEGVPHVLEVNPRLSGSVIATVAAGFNMLEGLVCLALGQDVPTGPIPYGASIRPSIRTVREHAPVILEQQPALAR